MADIIDIIKAVKGLAVDFGTVSAVASAGSSGLEDASKSWPPGTHRDRLVRVVDGAGSGQTRVIADNAANTLVTQTPWARPLDVTSVYVILNQGAERLLVDIALLLSRIGNPDADALASLSDKLGDMQRPLYLTIDEIGRWDAGGSLSTDVITMLNNLTEILNDLGPASGSTMGSLYAILGDPAQDFDTMVGYEGAASLADKLTLVRAAYLDKLPRVTGCMDFWSAPLEEVAVAAVAADQALPPVVVAGLPAGVAITRVVAMFKFRVVENTNGAANKLSGAQEIQVDDAAATGWLDAVNLVDDQFGVGGSLREGGDLCIGAIDIKARVDGNDTYSFRWAQALADLADLNFNDVQVGLRVYFTI